MTYPDSRPSASPLAPWRALLHPAWLLALAVLAVNDHVLKGAGVLPGVVTGKLSDLAGLFVAPALLASLLGVGGRRALAACHAAVGAGFAVIQVWAPAAAGLVAVTAWLGLPWVITMDPTDLLALPMLLVSWRVLVPAMARPRPGARLRRRALELAAASAGLACTMGTSVVEPPWLRPFDGDVFLYNDSEDETLALQVQALKPTVAIDCDAVMADPGRFLQPELFDVAQIWNIGPGQAGNLREVAGESETASVSCQVFRVSVTGVASPAIVAWWPQDIPRASYRFPGDGGDGGDGAPIEDAPGLLRVETVVNDDGDVIEPPRLVAPNKDDLVHRQRPAPEPEDGGLCAEQSDADRLFWAIPGGSALWHVESITAAPDGCTRLELRDPSAVQADGASQTGYLCVRPSVYPFAPGDWVRVVAHGDELTFQVVDDNGEAVEPRRVLYVGVGSTHLYLPGDLTVSARPIDTCERAVHDACGTLARPAELEVVRVDTGGARLLRAREGAVLPGNDGSDIEVHVVHALARDTVDADCTLGGAGLGPEYELWAVYRGG